MNDDTLENWDRILRSSVPDAFKKATSPVGAVQSYIACLEQALKERGVEPMDEATAIYLRN